MSETCGIQRNEGKHGTDTYTRIDKGKTAETLSGGMLLPVGMAGHYGLQFTRRYIRGKNVVLLDDVLTTGESFRQLQRKMKQLGALSVIGVFLGKTV